MMDSDPTELKRQKKSRIERVAIFISALAALATAIGAIYKPEVSARKAYEEMSKGLEKVSKDSVQNHDDIVALRNYLDGYTKARELTPVTVTSASSPSLTMGPPVIITPTHPTPAPPVIKNTKTVYTPPPYKQVTGKEDVSMF
jgi:hypothetical protein